METRLDRVLACVLSWNPHQALTLEKLGILFREIEAMCIEDPRMLQRVAMKAEEALYSKIFNFKARHIPTTQLLDLLTYTDGWGQLLDAGLFSEVSLILTERYAASKALIQTWMASMDLHNQSRSTKDNYEEQNLTFHVRHAQRNLDGSLQQFRKIAEVSRSKGWIEFMLGVLSKLCNLKKLPEEIGFLPWFICEQILQGDLFIRQMSCTILLNICSTDGTSNDSGWLHHAGFSQCVRFLLKSDLNSDVIFAYKLLAKTYPILRRTSTEYIDSLLSVSVQCHFINVNIDLMMSCIRFFVKCLDRRFDDLWLILARHKITGILGVYLSLDRGPLESLIQIFLDKYFSSPHVNENYRICAWCVVNYAELTEDRYLLLGLQILFGGYLGEEIATKASLLTFDEEIVQYASAFTHTICDVSELSKWCRTDSCRAFWRRIIIAQSKLTDNLTSESICARQVLISCYSIFMFGHNIAYEFWDHQINVVKGLKQIKAYEFAQPYLKILTIQINLSLQCLLPRFHGHIAQNPIFVILQAWSHIAPYAAKNHILVDRLIEIFIKEIPSVNFEEKYLGGLNDHLQPNGPCLTALQQQLEEAEVGDLNLQYAGVLLIQKLDIDAELELKLSMMCDLLKNWIGSDSSICCNADQLLRLASCCFFCPLLAYLFIRHDYIRIVLDSLYQNKHIGKFVLILYFACTKTSFKPNIHLIRHLIHLVKRPEMIAKITPMITWLVTNNQLPSDLIGELSKPILKHIEATITNPDSSWLNKYFAVLLFSQLLQNNYQHIIPNHIVNSKHIHHLLSETHPNIEEKVAIRRQTLRLLLLLIKNKQISKVHDELKYRVNAILFTEDCAYRKLTDKKFPTCSFPTLCSAINSYLC